MRIDREFPMKLGDVEIGSKLATWLRGSWRHSIRSAEVERITKTQVVAGDRRYNRQTGYEIGGGKWSSYMAEPWTAEHDAAAAEVAEENERMNIVSRMRDPSTKRLKLDQLRRIKAIMDEVDEA